MGPCQGCPTPQAADPGLSQHGQLSVFDHDASRITHHRRPARNGRQGESDMRIDYWKTTPEALKAMLGLQKYIQQSSLEPTLVKLVEIRASVMNGCAYCVDMH